MQYPDPKNLHPMPGFPQICFIKNVVSNPNIIIGDYTYYDDPEDSENFDRNVLYHYPFIGDKLIIGKFCAILLSTLKETIALALFRQEKQLELIGVLLTHYSI